MVYSQAILFPPNGLRRTDGCFPKIAKMPKTQGKSMDITLERAIQREAADALLNIGISIPLKEFRLPFRKRP